MCLHTLSAHSPINTVSAANVSLGRQAANPRPSTQTAPVSGKSSWVGSQQAEETRSSKSQDLRIKAHSAEMDTVQALKGSSWQRRRHPDPQTSDTSRPACRKAYGCPFLPGGCSAEAPREGRNTREAARPGHPTAPSPRSETHGLTLSRRSEVEASSTASPTAWKAEGRPRVSGEGTPSGPTDVYMGAADVCVGVAPWTSSPSAWFCS